MATLLILAAVIADLAIGGRPDPPRLRAAATTLDGAWRFHTGDDPRWANADTDDSDWETIDLTAAPDATIVDEEVLKDLGDAAKAVPFTAVIGADGHLTTLTVKVPKAGKNKAYTYTEKYADYGTAKPVAAPADGEAQEAPDSAYEMLNS